MSTKFNEMKIGFIAFKSKFLKNFYKGLTSHFLIGNSCFSADSLEALKIFFFSFKQTHRISLPFFFIMKSRFGSKRAPCFK